MNLVRMLVWLFTLAYVACVHVSPSEDDNKSSGDGVVTPKDRLVLKWDHIVNGRTTVRSRVPSDEEREALLYLMRPEFRVAHGKEIWTYRGPAWMEVNGEVWYFFVNSVYPSTGSQSERHHPDERVDFGHVSQEGELHLSNLVEWHKRHLRK